VRWIRLFIVLNRAFTSTPSALRCNEVALQNSSASM